MPNQFLTAQEIARQALPILRENLVFPLLAYRDYEDTFASFGDTIQVKKPPVYEAREFDGAIIAQDIQEDKVLVSLDKIADVSVEVGSKEMTLNIESFTDQVIQPAAVAIAEKINQDGFALYRDIPYLVGTAGSTPAELADFAAVRKALNIQKAPLGQRSAVWDPDADAKFNLIPAIVNAEKSGSSDALREGSIGRIQGLDNYMSQAVAHHEKGTLAASGGSIVLSTALDGTVPTERIVLVSTGVNTLSGTLVKGDILVINAKHYTVQASAQADDDAIEVAVYPAIASPVDTDDAVTVLGSHRANLAFHKNAFAFVSRPLELARGVESYVTEFEGLTLRVTFSYDAMTKKQMISIDTLYGYQTLYPELALRVLG